MKSLVRISIIDVIAVLLAVMFLYTLPSGRSWLAPQQVADTRKPDGAEQQPVAIPLNAQQPHSQTTGKASP